MADKETKPETKPETTTEEKTLADESAATLDAKDKTTTEKSTETESKGSEDNGDKTTSDEKTESTDKVETKTQTTDDLAEEPDARVVPESGDYTLPEGVPPHLAEFANENDFTQAQLDATLKQFGGFIEGTKIAEQKLLRESGDAHVDSWGESKDYNLALVRRALKQNDPDGSLLTMLNATGYGNHPAVLDFFLSIGNSMKEGGFISGAIHRPEGKKTAASTMFGKSHPSAN